MVVLQEARSPSLLLTCHELFLNWMSSLTRSPILRPITRNRARRPVARDLNGRSLMRQFPRVFRRPFPTFLEPSHSFLLLSLLHCRSCTEFDLGFSASRGLVLSAASWLNGSCKFRAINTIRLGRGRTEETIQPICCHSAGRPRKLLDGCPLLSTATVVRQICDRTHE